jgi:transcriptional regulator with XRE-family HTH domain
VVLPSSEDLSLGVVAYRLRQAREAAGISQRQLGIRAGLDESVASPRINQYEQGKHMPNVQMLERLGQLLERPLPWFYTTDDDMAAWILAFHQTDQAKRRKMLKSISDM